MTIAKALSPPPTREHDAERRGDRGRDPGPPRELLAETPRPARTRRRNNGPIIGQPIVLDTGANQEVVYRQAAHLAAARGAGAERRAERAAGQGPRGRHGDDARQRHPHRAADEGARDRRRRSPTRGRCISAAKATELRALLADAKAKADASRHRGRDRRAADVQDGGRGASRRCSSAG